jgi:hypothetical protein
MEEKAMRRLGLGIAVFALACTGFSQSNMYRNMGSLPGPYYPTANEVGDKITLTAGGRVVTSFSFSYIGDLNPAAGDETVKIRFYDATGANGGPGTMLWESTDMPIRDGAWTKTLAVPDVTVPDDMIWTAEFKNMGNIAGDRAGVVICNPPAIGTSEDNFWELVTGTWTLRQFTGAPPPVANFECSLWIDGSCPEPFDNYNTGDYYFPGFFEPGDDIQCEGNDRTINSLKFSIYCPRLDDDGEAEEVIVRIFKLDGITRGTPGTELWESAPIPFIADPNNEQEFTVAVPNIIVEDSFAYSLEFRGVLQRTEAGNEDAAGPIITTLDNMGTLVYNPPTRGTSRNFFWGHNVPAQPEWSTWFFGATGPPANFKMKFDGVSEALIVPDELVEEFGIHKAGTLASFATVDGDRWETEDIAPVFPGGPSCRVRVAGTSPTATPSSLKVKVVINTSGLPAGNIPQTIQVFNWTTGLWTTIDSRPATAGDSTIEITLGGTLSNYVQPGTRKMRVGMHMVDPANLFGVGWRIRINQVQWTVGG